MIMKFILTVFLLLSAKVSSAQYFQTDHPWMFPVLDSLGNWYYIHRDDLEKFNWLSDERDLVYMYDDNEKKIGYIRCWDGEYYEFKIPLTSGEEYQYEIDYLNELLLRDYHH